MRNRLKTRKGIDFHFCAVRRCCVDAFCWPSILSACSADGRKGDAVRLVCQKKRNGTDNKHAGIEAIGGHFNV